MLTHLLFFFLTIHITFIMIMGRRQFRTVTIRFLSHVLCSYHGSHWSLKMIRHRPTSSFPFPYIKLDESSKDFDPMFVFFHWFQCSAWVTKMATGSPPWKHNVEYKRGCNLSAYSLSCCTKCLTAKDVYDGWSVTSVWLRFLALPVDVMMMCSTDGVIN